MWRYAWMRGLEICAPRVRGMDEGYGCEAYPLTLVPPLSLSRARVLSLSLTHTHTPCPCSTKPPVSSNPGETKEEIADVCGGRAPRPASLTEFKHGIALVIGMGEYDEWAGGRNNHPELVGMLGGETRAALSCPGARYGCNRRCRSRPRLRRGQVG